MKDFIDFLKLPAYILGALAIASGIVLFSPEKITQLLYMTNFREEYGFTIGIIFVVSISILTVSLLKHIFKYVVDAYKNYVIKKNQRKYLLNIDEQKTDLIRMLLKEPTHTLLLPMDDGYILELQHFGIISPAGSTHVVTMPNPRINFFLQPWVEQTIMKYEELKAKFHC